MKAYFAWWTQNGRTRVALWPQCGRMCEMQWWFYFWGLRADGISTAARGKLTSSEQSELAQSILASDLLVPMPLNHGDDLPWGPCPAYTPGVAILEETDPVAPLRLIQLPLLSAVCKVAWAASL